MKMTNIIKQKNLSVAAKYLQICEALSQLHGYNNNQFPYSQYSKKDRL